MSFIEVDEYDNLEIHFKFGRTFKKHINTALKDSNQNLNIDALEQKVYQSNVNTFKTYFNSELVHYNMMQYILDTIGVETIATQYASYNQVFTPSVIEFLNNYVIDGKFKLKVFVETSQAAQLKNVKTIRPKKDEIHIWLVSRDGVNYDNFVVINSGIDVAIALENKKTTLKQLENLILEFIALNIQPNIVEQEKIHTQLKTGLFNPIL